MTVDVNAATLIGQPVSVVVQRLRQQKLNPRILWLPTDRQQPGRVAAIQPAGELPVGSIVTVVGALAIPASAATSQQAGNLKDSGNGQDDGNGNGKGNGKGKGKGKGDG